MKIHIIILSLLIFNFSYAQEIKTIENDSLIKISLEKSRTIFWNNLPKPINWTNDYEGIFSEADEKELNELISNFEKETTVEIAIVTIDTLKVSQDKFEDFSLHIAKTWGVGKANKDNGILIAISKGHRRIRIQNGDGIVPIISNEETQKIIDNKIIPNFKNENYFEGTVEGIFAIMELLKKN